MLFKPLSTNHNFKVTYYQDLPRTEQFYLRRSRVTMVCKDRTVKQGLVMEN